MKHSYCKIFVSKIFDTFITVRAYFFVYTFFLAQNIKFPIYQYLST